MSVDTIAADASSCVTHLKINEPVIGKFLSRVFEYSSGGSISLLGIGEKGTLQEGIFRKRVFVPQDKAAAVFARIGEWADMGVAAFFVPATIKDSAVLLGDVSADKILGFTSIVLDLDSGDVDAKVAYVTASLGAPSMVVASGGKTEEGQAKLHLWYMLNEETEEVERVAALRKTLAAKVGGDQSFGRVTQVVRIAGSIHAKNGVPSPVELLEFNNAEYDLDELAEIITAMQPMAGLPPPKAQQLATTPAGLMDFAPNLDTAVAALHRDIDEGGTELTRWGEFSKVAGFNISEVRAGRLTPEASFAATNGWMLTHMNPPWPQPRFDQEFTALVNKDIAGHGPFPSSVIATAQASVRERRATPASYPGATTIPPRPWLFGRWMQRGIVTAMIAPGGVGKSSLVQSMALSMASGREILGKTVYGGPLRVWSWNLEDGGDNLARGRIAAMRHHGISEANCGDRLFVDSGPAGATLCTAVEDRAGFTIMEPEFQGIVEAIMRDRIDALIVDPFVSSHCIDENDNNRVDAVVKRWAGVADETGCSIVLVHHSRKMNGETVTGDSARGASALNNAARTTLVLNRMTMDQAESWGIDPAKAKSYFSVADDKHNMAPAEAADWFELIGVSLDNARGPHDADNIGVVTRWTPPKAMDGVDASHLFAVQRVLHAGTYWQSAQSPTGWAGEVVANIMKLDASDPRSKKKIEGMLKVWLKSGALKIDIRRDPLKKDLRIRPAIIPGNWAADPTGPIATISDALAENADDGL